MSDLVVGIDLGTTNTCASYYFNGRINLLENEEGGRITASYLFITEENKFIVGQYARHMADNKPEHAIYEVKRLIGRKFNDPYVQKNLQYFSYNVVEEDNDIVVEIDQNGTKCRKTPEELCAAILSKVKKDVESKTCEHVDKAVITVPAYFNMSQREATLDAANKAGFTVLKLLNEPTAAALSYYLKNDSEDVNHCIVYDLGGGTFDVAILKRNGANIDILAVDGDTHLGGHDFDNLIIDYVVEILLKQYEYNARNDRRTMRRLRNKCEEAKKTLSFSEETRIVLEGVVRNHDAVLIDLTRQQFEQMCSHLFERTIKIVDSCMQKSGLKKNDIKEVILSGGSTRIPQIQKLISEYFNGKVLNTSVNPDECVAEGAAIQAALFSKHPKQKIDEILISDVCPLSLGIDTSFGLMSFVIARNTPIPTSATATVATARNQQSHMPVAVYEGERLDCRKNLHLGKIVVSDLTPAPPGQCKILVTMNIDHNGILKVSAKEKLRDNFKSLTISYTRGHRSDREIESALKDATDHKRDDEVFKKFALFKKVVFQYCERAKYNFENKELVESYRDVYDLCISSSKRVYHLKQKDQAELPNLFRAVVSKCEGIAKKHNFEFMPTLPKKLVTIFCS